MNPKKELLWGLWAKAHVHHALQIRTTMCTTVLVERSSSDISLLWKGSLELRMLGFRNSLEHVSIMDATSMHEDIVALQLHSRKHNPPCHAMCPRKPWAQHFAQLQPSSTDGRGESWRRFCSRSEICGV